MKDFTTQHEFSLEQVPEIEHADDPEIEHADDPARQRTEMERKAAGGGRGNFPEPNTGVERFTIQLRIRGALGLEGPGPRWSIQCPAHDDNNPSLTVQTSPDGKVLLSCHAGCRTEEILAKVGLTMADLFLRSEPNEPRMGKVDRIEDAASDYRDENGDLLYQVVRFDPKDFRHRRPDGDGGWKWDMKGVRRVLYRLPEVIQAIAEERRVWIVEGEKDADALWKLGLAATTNSGGAGKWQSEFATTLKGAVVTILPDNDPPGSKHAEDVARAIAATVAEVRVLRLPGLGEKGDVSDWLARGGTREELETLVARTPKWSEARQLVSSSCRYTVLSMPELLAVPPARWLVADFLPEKSVAILYGQPGSYKSFLALDVALSVAAGRDWHGREIIQGAVAYIAAEGHAGQIARRVAAWCEHHEQPTSLPVYTVCGPVDFGSEEAINELATRLPQGLGLIGVDTLSRCMPGIDENRTSDMTRVIAAADRLRTLTDATVLLVHHSRKHDSTMRGSSALEGAADTMISMKKQGPSAKVSCTKQKDAGPFADFWLRVEPVLESAVLVPMTKSSATKQPKLSDNDRALLGCLPSDGATTHAWLELFGKKGSSYYKSRHRLVDLRLVEEGSDGVWRATSSPTGESDDVAA